MIATETLPAAAPAEPTTPIKPSEALRLGRLLYPRRLRGKLHQGKGACAVGAIEAGLGHEFRVEAGDFACPSPLFCPDPWLRQRSLRGTVTHLNDEHGFGDEPIVAWLESLGR